MRLLTLDRMSERYGCRPSDIADGSARDAALDLRVFNVAGEFGQVVASASAGDSGPSYAEATAYIWRMWAREAEAELNDGVS